MQPHSRSIFDLFDGKKRYVVPLFQRQYVWNLVEQWQPLWEDIERKFAERLFGKDGPPHFLGAMVLDQKRVYGNAVPIHLVIDGQQRLTTFQIFLSAFRDVCFEQGQPAFGEECQRYLVNTGIMTDTETERYKVWPTNLDRPQFTDVVDAGSRAEVEKRHPPRRKKYARKYDPRPTMVECYLFFHDQIVEFLKNEDFPHPLAERIAKLHEALRTCLQVVSIELEGNDDPQVIFETLNARGQPLLPSDLLRNFIFWRAAQSREPQEELYNEYWLAFDDQFWRFEERQGRLFRPRSDIFLQHYLTLKRTEEINIGHLFAEYKYWITNARPFLTVRDELKEMQKHRGFFRTLIEPDPNTSVGRLSRALQIFDIGTIYPLVLGLLERELPEEVEAGIFSDLESYIVRRAVCNLTTKNYNRLFLSFLTKLPEGGLDRPTFRRILLDSQGDSSVWPRDEIFEQAWLSSPSYDILGSGRAQHVLLSLERCLLGSRSERVEIKSDLTVEHVLPQEWIAEWPLPNGNRGVTWFERWDNTRNKDDIAQTEVRDKLKHTFGNLTLLTRPLNSSVSNAAFATKKPEILKNSALALNRHFQEVDDWDEQHIITRGKALFEQARKIWPYPS